MNQNIERAMYFALGSAALMCCIQRRIDRRRRQILDDNTDWDQSPVWEAVPEGSRRGKMVIPKKVNWKGWSILIDLDCCAEIGSTSLNYNISSSELKLLHTISKTCGDSLYLMKEVQSDEEQAAIQHSISLLGLRNFPLHNLLFCSTEIGRKAIGRQLSPTLCVESNYFVIEYLSPHITYSCYVSDCPQDDPPSVYQTQSLSQYFDILDGIISPDSIEIQTLKSSN